MKLDKNLILEALDEYYFAIRRFIPSKDIFMVYLIEFTLLIISLRMIYLYLFDKDYAALIFYVLMMISLKMSSYWIRHNIRLRYM